jgi:hypothetical protein
MAGVRMAWERAASGWRRKKAQIVRLARAAALVFAAANYRSRSPHRAANLKSIKAHPPCFPAPHPVSPAVF